MSTQTQRVRELVNNLNLGTQKEKAGDFIVRDPGPAVPDSAEATSPTTAEYNGLLASLRAAGVIES